MTEVAILISGGGSNMVRLVESMAQDHPGRPCLVLSNKAEAGGLAKAQSMGVETAVVDHRPFKGDRAAFGHAVQAELDRAGAEFVCYAGFMRIMDPGFAGAWRGRALNIHPSLLPKYPGLNTHERALEAGDTEAGCTVHEVTEDLDDGPIRGQGRVPILPGDTAKDLAARVLGVEHQLYPKVLKRVLCGDHTPVELNEG